MSAPIVLALRMLLAVTLYVFLGWALFTIWRDLQAQGAFLADRKIPGINLKIKLKELPLQQLYFNQSEILLGRDSFCDIPLQDETVSVRHARLSYHHGQWWLEDLGSTNGTLLNNEVVTIPTVIISDDIVECGKASITIGLGAESGTTSTQRISKSGDSNDK